MNRTPSVTDIDKYSSSDTQYDHCIAYRNLTKLLLIQLLLVIFSLAIASCADQGTPYRPPTIAAYSTPPALVKENPTSTVQVITSQLPTVTTQCTNDLAYLEDLSIPDGTIVHPGDKLDKQWLIQNSGTCNWDQHYRLKFVSGTDLNASLEQALYPARSGTKATIQILFTAPTSPGSYKSAWQAYSPEGQPFGDTVYLQVTVENSRP